LIAGAWLLWASVYAWVLNRYGIVMRTAAIDSAINNSLLAIGCYLVSHILRYYLPEKNRYMLLFVYSFVISLLCFIVGKGVVLHTFEDQPGYSEFFFKSAPLRFGTSFLVISCVTFMNTMMNSLKDQKENQQRKTDAEKLTREAELYKLRQQLQPHFLFNSLNSINALVVSNPEHARTMIQQLSEFLRGTIRREDNQTVNLSEELQHLQLYLDIEKVRFGHRLHTEIKIDEDAYGMKLPALLLQPLVENAIKFGLYDTVGDVTIEIIAKKNDGLLEVTVKNPFDPETSVPGKGTGFGLSSVNRRLYLLFGRTDLLKTITDENIFVTGVKIPQA
jgi:two-component system LytT family sensor kinase